MLFVLNSFHMNRLRLTYLLLVALLFFTIASCSSDRPGAVIEGHVSGFTDADSVNVSLFYFFGMSGHGKEVMRDTLRDGCFRFIIDSVPDILSEYDIMLNRNLAGRSFEPLSLGTIIYLEPGAHVRIEIDSIYAQTAVVHSRVTDQKLQQQFIRKMPMEALRQNEKIFVERSAIAYGDTKGLTKAERDSLSRRLKALDAHQRQNSDKIIFPAVLDLLETEPFGQFAMDELLGYAPGVSMGYYKGETLERIIRLADRMSPDQRASETGRTILGYLDIVAPVGIGDPIPEYPYVDKGGVSHTLAELKGKTILLDFWATWCGPCIKAVPKLKTLSESFGDKLTIVSINLDPESSWKTYTEEHPIHWIDWRDPKGTTGSIRAYQTTGIPTFVIISTEGIIVDIIEGFYEDRIRKACSQDR